MLLSSALAWFVLPRNPLEDKSLSKIFSVPRYCNDSMSFSCLNLWSLSSNFSCFCKRTVSRHELIPLLMQFMYLPYQYFALIVSITRWCSAPFFRAKFSIALSGTPPSVLARAVNNFLFIVLLCPVLSINF